MGALMSLLAKARAIIAEMPGANTASASCPADVTERAAIVAEGDGCNREEADRRALSEHGQETRQALAEQHRAEITAALDRLPKSCSLREPTCSMRLGSMLLPRASTTRSH